MYNFRIEVVFILVMIGSICVKFCFWFNLFYCYFLMKFFVLCIGWLRFIIDNCIGFLSYIKC